MNAVFINIVSREAMPGQPRELQEELNPLFSHASAAKDLTLSQRLQLLPADLETTIHQFVGLEEAFSLHEAVVSIWHVREEMTHRGWRNRVVVKGPTRIHRLPVLPRFQRSQLCLVLCPCLVAILVWLNVISYLFITSIRSDDFSRTLPFSTTTTTTTTTPTTPVTLPTLFAGAYVDAPTYSLVTENGTYLPLLVQVFFFIWLVYMLTMLWVPFAQQIILLLYRCIPDVTQQHPLLHSSAIHPSRWNRASAFKCRLLRAYDSLAFSGYGAFVLCCGTVPSRCQNVASVVWRVLLLSFSITLLVAWSRGFDGRSHAFQFNSVDFQLRLQKLQQQQPQPQPLPLPYTIGSCPQNMERSFTTLSFNDTHSWMSLNDVIPCSPPFPRAIFLGTIFLSIASLVVCVGERPLCKLVDPHMDRTQRIVVDGEQ